MNIIFQSILTLIEESLHLTGEEKKAIIKSIIDADKVLEITTFKLDRTEKVKRTMAILLEETIEELEQKRKAVEEQNKELEIEAATERVRMQSMAMQHPSDFEKVNKELLHQLTKLKIDGLSGVSFYFIDEDEIVTVWDLSSPGSMSNPNSYSFKYDSKKYPVLGGFVDILKTTQEDYFILDFPKPSLLQGIEELKEINSTIGKALKNAVESGALSHQWNPAVRITDGILSIDLMKPPGDDTKTILLKMAGAFNQAYTRFLDLQKAEAQAREAQIELALERVRSRTMAMQHSNDLQETALLLFNNVKALGAAVFGCGFNIWDEDRKAATAWMAGENRLQPPFKTSSSEDVFLQIHEATQQGHLLFVKEQSGDVLEKHYRYMASIPTFQTIMEQMSQTGTSIPAFQIIHCAFFHQGYLMFITYEPVPEAYDIFQRFAKVFEQTYTRFLDLQKAEAQVREAEIQLALERVRARTMAMQQSDELNDVAAILFNQLRSLGGSLWTCAIVLCNDMRNEDEFRTAFESGLQPSVFVPHNEDEVHIKMYEGWKNATELFTISKDGSELQAHYAYLMTVPSVKPTFEKMLASGISFPVWQKWHAAYFTAGYLMIITTEHYKEGSIFVRFAKVFEQAYTRFLDLQNAEAQTREAQIEAALEKARSRSMSMQSSDELPEVANVLFLQIQALGIPAWSCGYNILAEDKRSATCCMSSEGTLQTPFKLRLVGEASFDEWGDFVHTDQTMLVQELADQSLDKHYSFMKSFPDLKPTFDQIDALGLTLPTYQINHLCKFNQGFLLFITYEKVPQSHDIFKRFTRVFEQTYTRFNDLKQAEAQAREAKIETSLERVRARTMAMQKSDELAEASALLFKQMKLLGVDTYTSGFTIWDIENSNLVSWMCNADGSMNPPFVMPVAGEQWHWEQYESWKNGDEFIVKDFTGAEMQSHFQYLRSLPLLEEAFKKSIAAGHPMPERQVHNVVNFSQGNLLFITLDTCTGAYDIFKKFAKAFEQTYTRFLDLQRVEAQAREAQIEAGLERVRSRSLAMHNTSELQEVIHTVHKELLKLDIAVSGGSFIAINSEITTQLRCWGSGGTADTSEEVHLPLYEKPFCANLISGIKNGPSFFTEEFTQQEKQEFFTFLFEHNPWSNLGPTQKNETLSAPGGYTRSCCVSMHTSIFIINHYGEQFSESDNEILKRFGKVFEQAYTRFLDLQKAEAQADQAHLDLIQIQTEKKRAENALIELRATQAQLIQKEKLASLGELTAGIAHEIQNPLNFVNNFSEVSTELVDELKEELAKGDVEEAGFIADDLRQNLKKIIHHGSRASAIVKGMLEHSRASTGEKQLTNLNQLADEYLRLAYHGLLAKDKANSAGQFNCKLVTDFDPNLGEVNLVAQDIGRVLLNLYNNAFYAVQQRQKLAEAGYEPTVWVRTQINGNQVRLQVRDNGTGIPDAVKAKIFQPFFTTKPTGEGTGLGLSLSYDIVTKGHGGTLDVKTQENEGTEFKVQLPR